MSNNGSRSKTFFWKTLFAGLLIMLVVGILIGYMIWGKEVETPNIKQLLAQIADRIESLEDENTILKDQIKNMKDTVEKGEKSIQSEELMKKELTKLRDENEKLKTEMEDYDQLQLQLKELRSKVEKVEDVIK
jgi:cell division protein FtsB